MTLVLAMMSGTATVIGMATFLFPQVPIPDRSFQIIVTVSGVPGAGCLFFLWRRVGNRMPLWFIHAWLVLSTVMICLGSWSARTSPMSVASTSFLVWIGLYAGHFLPRRLAVAHTAWIAVCLSVLLAVNGDAASASVGVMVFGIVVAATGASRYLSERLGRLAVTDPLTRLPNRQALDAILQHELSRCARHHTPLCVGIVDVDNFKRVNDTQGHMAGDAILVALADRWKAGLRELDAMARYGGDEFVVVMPGCDLGDGRETFDRLRKLGGVACSVGVAAWVPGDTDDTLMARADQALYAAKDAGRDRVMTLHPVGVAQPTLWPAGSPGERVLAGGTP